MQLLEILNLTTGYFEKQGIASARLNAELLLCHVLGMQRMQIYLQFDRPVSDAERTELRELLRRRAAGEPLQHIVGHCFFHGLRLACDKRALIPRPETEVLVELALRHMHQEQGSLLDVGTGTGAIALALLHAKPGWRGVGADFSSEALALAAENAASLSLAERITFHCGDLSWPTEPEPFDIITANLPYIPTGEIARLGKEVLHDPMSALDGGGDGLEVIRRLLPKAHSALRSGGMLLLEIHPPQAERLPQELGTAGFEKILVHDDLTGRARIVSAQRL